MLRPRCRASLRALAALLIPVVFAVAATAQAAPGSPTASAPAAAPGSAEEPLEAEPPPGSPRAALQKFIELTRLGRYADAGAFVEVPRAREEERAALAQRLRAVLDRHVVLDLDKVSDQDAGTLNDGLPARYEQIGTVRVAGDVSEPVRLARRSGSSGWVFSLSTVARIDDWYQALPDRWLRQHLPGPLLQTGPRDLLWWQWAGLALLAVVGSALGMLTGALVRSVLGRAAKRTVTIWDDRILARSRGPVALAFTVGFMRALLPQLLLYEPAERFVHQVLRALLLANVLWAFWRLVDVVAELSWSSEFSFEHPSSRALIPLARRMGKAVVAVAAILLLISALGYPVTSLIAGLGIGGLALALASQKTVENLFGAFSLGIDQPFREGDFVRVEDLTGTVESLGLRSTRIRTPDRTVVSIPNGKLAEMRLETFAARDRLRLACILGLEYATTADQMRQVLAEIERSLREHPKIHPEGTSVRFIELAPYSLNVEIVCFFATRDAEEFTLIRQDVLLEFLQIVEKSGTRIAFPTRTLHVQTDASSAAA
ncbi:MAG: mechanosensitive ion channel family protein [Myxococcales bacterium]|nr:MAG: mechanosensitive ion channel family protein [Myxococcales bacterium]